MSEDQRKILDMLSQGKISVDEAEKLLAVLTAPESPEVQEATSPAKKLRFKYLRVVVEPGPESKEQDKVNIRVPMKLIRSGLKWASFIPKDARKKVDDALSDKGIDLDFDKITADDIEELLSSLGDLTVEVEGKEKIRIFCE